MHNQHAQSRRRQFQRHVGATTQRPPTRIGSQCLNIRIRGEADTFADRKPDPGRACILRDVQHVAIAREQQGGGVRPVNALERDHVPSQCVCVPAQRIDVLLPARCDVGWKRRIPGLALGQPVDIPGRQLEILGVGGRPNQRQNGKDRCKHLAHGWGPFAAGPVPTGVRRPVA